MTPLLEQFLSEARDFLQDIGESLMALERDPTDSERMGALFRLVHTLKGNSGLFDFPEMTRVLHAGEDLMDAVRDQRLVYGPEIADPLLDAMDFVGILLDDIEADERIADGRMRDAARIAEELREVLARSLPAEDDAAAAEDDSAQPGAGGSESAVALPGLASPLAGLSPRERQFWPLMRQSLAQAPESLRESLLRAAFDPQTPGPVLHWVAYTPEEDSFYKGEDPLYQVIQLADVEWRRVVPREPWPALVDLDAYQCVLRFEWLTRMDAAALDQHFRYVPEQVVYLPVTPAALLPLDVARDPEQEAAVFAALRNTLAELPQDSGLVALWRWLLLVLELNPAARAQWGPWLEGLANVPAQALPEAVEIGPAEGTAQTAVVPVEETAEKPASEPLDDAVASLYTDIWETQREVLELSDKPGWFEGRLRGVVASLAALLGSAGRQDDQITLTQAFMEALAQQDPAPLRDWLQAQPEWIQGRAQAALQPAADASEAAPPVTPPVTPDVSPDDAATPEVLPVADAATAPAGSPEAPAFGRRAEDHPGNKVLKVDQGKIDRLMGLIGEMVVAKNALPYLAGRAENKYGVRELSREIRAQYGVINRIAEEMQDAIMQVRMLPVSFVFQRFPRLVRDLSRKLGKQVRLEIEGESTEADKNIIEAMADPLVHIVRNSLDHGLEMPEQRQAQGKPAEGRLTIRASQVSDRVVIEIIDDGRGIDPEVIRHKAYERGLLDEAELERLSDREAVNLVFAAGFSTAEQISDVSGRGVGMDVVRTAITRLNGSIDLESEVNRGTRLRLSLPLSMAVSHVMIIESAGQRFGVPMDAVAETVRIPAQEIRGLKHHQTAVLRGQIVPVLSLNELLGFAEPQHPNEDDEYAALVVKIEQEQVGVLVDECREAVDIILKPFSGILQGMSGYAGSALLGDGSVLLIVNPRELLG